MLDSLGSFWLENQSSSSTSYMDQTVGSVSYFVPTVVTTSWCKIQGVNGYQRATWVQLTYQEMDDCGLTMSIAVNYASGFVQSFTWPSGKLDELAVPVVQQHVGAKYNKSMSLQITVSDAAGTSVTNGQGARFVGLSMELEKLGDTFRQVPAIGRG